MKRTKIFISASPTSEPEREWSIRFTEALSRIGGYEEGEVYLYLKQKAGRDIPEEVKSRIKQARRMICLISDHYLESPWCALEHQLFFGNGPGYIENCIGIIQPFLHGWVGAGEFKKKRAVQNGIVTMEERRTLELTRGLRSHLEGPWEHWLLRARHIEEFHDLAEWPGLLNDDLSDRLRELADPTSPIDRLLERNAALCVYAIAADRFHDGGWGFSLGSHFDYDDDDGSELPRGRYDFNVVILRTLAEFLGEDELAHEWDAVFGMADEGRKSRVRVDDRLPMLASVLSSLVAGDSLRKSLQARPLIEGKGGNLAESRWVLDEEDEDERNFAYNATLFVTLTRLFPSLKDFSKGNQRKLNDMRAALDESRRHAEQVVAGCIRDQNLFTATLESSREAASGTTSNRTHRLHRNRKRLAGLWLLLMLAPDCAAQLGREITRTVGAWTTDSFAELFDNIDALVDSPDPDSETLSLSLACLAVLSSKGVNAPQQAEMLEQRIIKLLQREDVDRILLRLDVLAWVSLVLFAVQASSRPIDVSLLEFMWHEGRELREERRLAIGKASEAADIRTEILKRVREQAHRAYDGLYPTSGSAAEVAADLGRVSFEEFIEQLLGASFWGQPVQSTIAEASKGDGAFLSGVLRVRATTNQVELETPGYNQMFLHPFSEITGMNIANLRNLRREFGDLDASLVRLMGETVVRDCFERFKDDFIRSSRSFEDRTRYITEMLTSSGWDQTQGFDDILIIRRGAGDGELERWVYRTALIHAAAQAPGGEDALISWRFVEMPPQIQKLISTGPRIEKLSNDRRPSA